MSCDLVAVVMWEGKDEGEGEGKGEEEDWEERVRKSERGRENIGRG